MFCMSYLYEMFVVIQVNGEMEWLIAYAYGHLYLNSDLVRFSQHSLCLAFTKKYKNLGGDAGIELALQLVASFILGWHSAGAPK